LIYHYGITQRGAYHVANGTVCQDAHYYKMVDENFAIGAVADGLGSEQYSDVASKIAVKVAVEYCEKNITRNINKNEIIAAIKNSYKLALQEINNKAITDCHDVNQYDTTLVVCVMLDNILYYGNSGDSGILILNESGYYEKLTEQQRDEEGRVYPLCFGEEKWVFGYKDNIGSALLATDGMLESFFPAILKNEPVNMYIPLAQFLMSEDCLKFKLLGEEKVNEKIDKYIASIPGSQINDDKTVLLMLNTNISVKRLSDDYYKEPDWEELERKRKEYIDRILYPSRYNDGGQKKEGIINNKEPEADKKIEDNTRNSVETTKEVVYESIKILDNIKKYLTKKRK